MTALLGRQLGQRGNGPPAKAIATDAANANVEASAASPPLRLWGRALPPLASVALLLGSFMPDVPLTLWTVVYGIIDRRNGVVWNSETPGDSLVGLLFDDMFFNDPWVKVAHNLFHAPILTLAYALMGYWLWRSARRVAGTRARWGAGLFWFGVACTLHTVIDILVHHNDGPLLLFPFEWSIRFSSPVSYWDPDYYGIPFAIFEHILLLLMLIPLVQDWWRRRQQRRQPLAG